MDWKKDAPILVAGAGISGTLFLVTLKKLRAEDHTEENE